MGKAPATLAHQTIGCFPRLTPRELSILRLVAKGCTNVQIAASLHISKYTVAQHIAKMLHRTGAANRTDLVCRAHTAGILNGESETKQLAIRRRYLSPHIFLRPAGPGPTDWPARLGYPQPTSSRCRS
jgi:DNA-binding CsgD family transcriptional regulator